jgi:glycosyltransferase involved in cell wall biosynthesis
MPDVPPIAEVIADGVNGMLFRPEDAAALGGALAKLIEDEAFRRRLGARARQDALERHTWSANARRVMQAVAERKGFATKTPGHQEQKSG